MHMEVDSEMSTTETTNDVKTSDKVEKDITDLNLPIPDETATACLITVSLTCEVFQNLNWKYGIYLLIFGKWLGMVYWL